MKGGKDDKSKCTVQAKAGRNGKVVFATLSPLGFLFPMDRGNSLSFKYKWISEIVSREVDGK